MKNFKATIETDMNKGVFEVSKVWFKLMEYSVFLKGSFGLHPYCDSDDWKVEIIPHHVEYGFVFDIYFDELRICVDCINEEYCINLDFYNMDMDDVVKIIQESELYFKIQK